MIPMMSGFFEEATRYAAENPEQVTVTAGPGQYWVQIHDPDAELMPDMSGLFWAVRLVFVAAGVLLAEGLLAAGTGGSRGGAYARPLVKERPGWPVSSSSVAIPASFQERSPARPG